MTPFLQRLQQRKLVQWTLAYLAGGWLLLQVADLAVETYHWPPAVMHVLFAILVLGLVVTWLLAWYHGEQGRQHVSGVELLLLAGVFAIGGFLIWRFAIPRKGHAPSMARATPASVRTPVHTGSATTPAFPSSIPAKSIAVLPFENLSTDKANAYFADGMQDLILTKLADIGELKVISRTSTMQYGSHPENLQKIGRQLGVATILEGSVQKAGDQVLINVQLIDAGSDSHIWAESYTRTLDNIFGVEGEVADKIAGALKARLTASESAAVARIPTHNKQAYKAYLKSVYFLDDSNRTGDVSELQKSIALSREAVAADPNFAAAWVLLALGYQKIGNHAEDAEKAALRALAIAPDSAGAHGEYAFALVGRKHFKQAIAQAKESVRLKPRGMKSNLVLGFVYQKAGHLDESAAVFARTVRLYPQVNFIRKSLADVEMAQRRYTAARKTLRYVVDRDPADVVAATSLAQVELLGFGDVDAARRALQGVPTAAASSGTLSDAWYWLDMDARDYPAALAVIRQAPASWFRQQDYPLALYQAQVYRAQGDSKLARRYFKQARVMLEAEISQAPKDADLRVNLALALAGLGNAKDAGVQAQRAVRLENPWAGYQALLNLAVVRAWTGRTGLSLKMLRELLQEPAGDVISVNLLKLDPAWDSIRRTPAFQGLLKTYATYKPVPDHPVTGS